MPAQFQKRSYVMYDLVSPEMLAAVKEGLKKMKVSDDEINNLVTTKFIVSD